MEEKQRLDRDNSVDLLKIFFTVLVIIGHSRWISSVELFKPAGRFVVEDFFVISGYYMTKGYFVEYRRYGTTDACIYITGRIRRFLIDYIVSTSIVVGIYELLKYLSLGTVTITSLIIDFLHEIPELLGIYMLGFTYNNNIYNQPAWYLCSLIVALMIMYYNLCNYGKGTLYFAPLIGIAVLGWRYTNGGVVSLMDWHEVSWLGFVPSGVVRAIGDVNIGIFVYCIVERVKGIDCRKATKFILSVVEIAGWILLTILTQNDLDLCAEAGWIIISYILLVISFSGQTILCDVVKGRNFKKTLDFCFAMYLTHFGALAIVRHFYYDRSYFENVGVFVIIAIGITFLEMIIVRYLRKIVKKTWAYKPI